MFNVWFNNSAIYVVGNSKRLSLAKMSDPMSKGHLTLPKYSFSIRFEKGSSMYFCEAFSRVHLSKIHPRKKQETLATQPRWGRIPTRHKWGLKCFLGQAKLNRIVSMHPLRRNVPKLHAIFNGKINGVCQYLCGNINNIFFYICSSLWKIHCSRIDHIRLVLNSVAEWQIFMGLQFSVRCSSPHFDVWHFRKS